MSSSNLLSKGGKAVFFKLLSAAFTICIFFSISSNGQSLSEAISTATVKNCPINKDEWIKAKKDLFQSKNMADLFAFSQLAVKCSRTNAVEKNIELKNCLEKIKPLNGLLETTKDSWISLEKNNRLLSKQDLILPKEFQNPIFWQTISSKKADLIKKEIAAISRRYPKSTTFKFQSYLQPHVPVYITVLEEPDQLTILDYDTDLNINVYKEKKSAKALVSIGRDDLTELPPGEQVSMKDLNTSALQAPMSHQGGRCYQCHQAPILPIIPLSEKSLEVFQGPKSKIIKWFNEKYAQKNDRFPTNQFSFLPNFGDLTDAEAITLQEKCYPETSGLQKTRIQESFKCARCHSENGIMPPIKLPMGPAGFFDQNKITWDTRVHRELGVAPHFNSLAVIPQHLMLEGKMPPEFEDLLSKQERQKAYNCLVADYFGKLYPLPGEKFNQEEGRLLRTLFSDQNCKDL